MRRKLHLFLLWRCPMPNPLRQWYRRRYGPKPTPYAEWPDEAKARMRAWIVTAMKENR